MTVGIMVAVMIIVFIFIAKMNTKKKTNTPVKIIKADYSYLRDADVQAFLNTHPKEREIVNLVRTHKIALYSGDNKIEELFQQDAIATFEIMDRLSGVAKTTSCIVLTSNMAYMHKAEPEKDIFYFAPNIHKFLDELELRPVKMRTSYTKKSNVAGSAIAGGIIAGGVGAVVGAAVAASNNANGGKTAYGKEYESTFKELTVKSITDHTGTVQYIHTAKKYRFPKIARSSLHDFDKVGNNFNCSDIYNMMDSNAAIQIECFINALMDLCKKFDSAQ